MQIKSATLSHRGRKRSNNEDFVASFEPTDPVERARNGNLYIIADGVGGEAQGERASQYAAEKLLYEFYNRNDLEPGERLRQVITQINEEIYNFAEQSANISRMATTLVAVLVQGNVLTVANVGDSRAYLIRGGNAQQITRDHSLVGELVRNGEMTEAQAQASRMKNNLTRSLGGEAEVHADIFPTIPLQTGDKILLCTDGLTRYALSQDIARLTMEGTPEQIARRLVSYANQHGGVDNVSVILVDCIAGLAEEDSTEPFQKPQPVSWDTMQTKPLPLESTRKGSFKRAVALIPKKYIPYFILIAMALATIIIGGRCFLGPSHPATSPVPATQLQVPWIQEGMNSPRLTQTQELEASLTAAIQLTATETLTPTVTIDLIPTVSFQDCVYTVQEGDWLSTIELSTHGYTDAICSPESAANGCNIQEYPNRLIPGWEIIFHNVLPSVCLEEGGKVQTPTPPPNQ